MTEPLTVSDASYSELNCAKYNTFHKRAHKEDPQHQTCISHATCLVKQNRALNPTRSKPPFAKTSMWKLYFYTCVNKELNPCSRPTESQNRHKTYCGNSGHLNHIPGLKGSSAPTQPQQTWGRYVMKKKLKLFHFCPVSIPIVLKHALKHTWSGSWIGYEGHPSGKTENNGLPNVG